MESLLNTTYPSFQAAKEAADAVAKTEGYALTIRTTKKDKTGQPTLVAVRCSKGGKFKVRTNEAATHVSRRRAKSATQITGCEFRLVLKPKAGGWVVSCPHDRHNHRLADDPMVFPKYRTVVIQKYLDDIIRKFNNNTRPTDIAGELRDCEDPDLAGVTAKDISNALAKHRLNELAGRSPLQFLYDQLDKDDFFYRDTRDEQGRLTGLFLAPYHSLNRWHKHYEVLILDCTYKTNRFNMPLLNICAATRDNKTFSVASIFLNGETESHYRWAVSLLLILCEMQGIPFPKVTVTDRDIALLKALSSFHELRDCTHLLCTCAH